MARVLIVDDDDSWGRLAGRRLERAGIAATFHLGSLGALNAICLGGYDLLLLDVKMQGLDGPRIAHTLYHMRALPRPKLVFCSSIDIDDLQQLAQKLKADGYLSKSAGADKLVQIVRHLLEVPAGERVSRVVPTKAGETGATRCPLCGLDQASGDS